MYIEEQTLCEDSVLSALGNFEKGKFPVFNLHQFEESDAKLNNVYKKIQHDPKFEYGTVTKAAIRTAQIQWILYRNAWVKFCQVKYPAMDTTALKTWLTNSRAGKLEEFITQ
jgi:uncharacterized protein YecT (DUF1311 family)